MGGRKPAHKVLSRSQLDPTAYLTVTIMLGFFPSILDKIQSNNGVQNDVWG
jgi:hypothetical protein